MRRSDRELIAATLEGGREYFEELVRRHEDSLYYYLLRRHLPEDAQDVTQETFLQAWRSLGNYDPRWEFSTWLFSIGYRCSAGFFRRRKRDVTQGASRDAEILGQVIAPEIAEEIIAPPENLWDIAREVLPEPQVSALWLFYVEEKTVREIALIMRRTEVGIKTLLFRGRKRLKKYV